MTNRFPDAHLLIARAIVAAALLSVGCVAGDPLGPPGPGANIPAVGMSPGEFGFAITARDWTSDQTYTPELATGALQVGFAVVGYRGGTGHVTVTDADGAIAFNRDLAGNVAQGSSVVHGRAPFRVRVAASGYTGLIALGVNAGPGGG